MRNRRIFVIAAAFALVVTMSMVAYAYLSTNSGLLNNNFSVATDPELTVSETFNNIIKTDVAVNVGNPGYAVYVRAIIVITWKDASGNVYASAPVAGRDYELTLNDTDWFESNGFYYHKDMVTPTVSTEEPDVIDPSTQMTNVLINSCALKSSAEIPDGYNLSVEIIAQTIQALGSTDGDDSVPAVTDAWGVTVENGMLKAN